MLIAIITYAFFAYALMGAAFAKMRNRTTDDLAMLVFAPVTVWFVMFDYAKKRQK